MATALALVLMVGVAYSVKMRAAPETSTQETAMKAGLDALYSKNDPAAAIGHFRTVLGMNPTHYGATYQLAVALDRAGNLAEARLYWEKMLPMAQSARDDATAAAARTRLQRAPTSEEQQTVEMKAGLDALSSKNDLVAAVGHFRKVLALNPAHYGATYQLAAALDRAGKRDEATLAWKKVLELAGTYRDQATMDAARSRLAGRQ